MRPLFLSDFIQIWIFCIDVREILKFQINILYPISIFCLLAASPVLYTTSCKHSLLLLRMGEIIARNMLSWLKLSIKLLMLHPVGCLYYCINDARSHKYHTFLICWFAVYFNIIPLTRLGLWLGLFIVSYFNSAPSFSFQTYVLHVSPISSFLTLSPE